MDAKVTTSEPTIHLTLSVKEFAVLYALKLFALGGKSETRDALNDGFTRALDGLGEDLVKRIALAARAGQGPGHVWSNRVVDAL